MRATALPKVSSTNPRLSESDRRGWCLTPFMVGSCTFQKFTWAYPSIVREGRRGPPGSQQQVRRRGFVQGLPGKVGASGGEERRPLEEVSWRERVSGPPLRRRGKQVLRKSWGGRPLGLPLRGRRKQVLRKRAGGCGPWTYLCGAGIGRFGVKEGPGCKACCAFRGGFSWPIVRSDLDSVKVANPDEPIA